MLVYFLRHASAGDSLINPVQDDQRPLDKKGIEQCGNVGRLLRALDVRVGAIISSPLKRAKQTAALVAEEIGYDAKPLLDAALAPGASFEDFRGLLRRYAKQEAIMVVGHNPSLSQFLSLLVTNGQFDQAVDMSKGSIARVEYDRQPVLRWMVTPKVARAAQSDSKAASSRPKTSRK
ncbi:MAG: histidine phosphatase family protein [Candidatus Korobacteraceae bacterium]|jgi:phosphohistidine phosphatase